MIKLIGIILVIIILIVIALLQESNEETYRKAYLKRCGFLDEEINKKLNENN